MNNPEQVLAQSSETPVCIVGAGPAGATASLMLSKLQIPHIIIDKAIFPRDKTCGDGLILHVFEVLRRIDPALLQAFVQHPAFIHTFAGRFFVKKDLSIDIDVQHPSSQPHPPIFYGKRIDFDDFLVKQLPSPYADIRLGCGLKDIERIGNTVLLTLSDGSTIQTSLVIGADGIQSIVSKKLAGNQHDKSRVSTFVSAYFQGLTNLAPAHEAEIRLIYKKMPLFFYIFPLPNGEANVSLGGTATDISLYRINLRAVIEDIIANHPEVRNKFLHAKRIGEWRGWGIPYSYGSIKITGDNFLLVGDAAGLANPFYKEGVGTGMMSALIAAEKAASAYHHGRFDENFLSSYADEAKKQFHKLLLLGRIALKFTKKPLLFQFFIRLTKGKIEKRIVRLIDSQAYGK